MRTLLLLAAMAVLPAEAPTAEAQEPSAGEIIKKSEAAYAAVKTFVGTTTVRSKSDHGFMKLEQVSSARVTFMRPGKVRIEGQTASREPAGPAGHPFTIVSDGTTTWKSWAIQNNGAFQEVKGVGGAGMGGVAHGAAETIPAALMKSDGAMVGGSDPFIVPRLAPPTLVGHEIIDGADCYKLVVKSPRFGDVAMWIDSKTYLLRQMARDKDEKQLAEQKRTVEEALRKAGRQPPAEVSNIKSTSALFSFTIDYVDTPVDEKLFADPTKK